MLRIKYFRVALSCFVFTAYAIVMPKARAQDDAGEQGQGMEDSDAGAESKMTVSKQKKATS